MVFDTGATETIICPKMVKKLIESGKTVNKIPKSVAANTNSGEQMIMTEMIMVELTLGEQKVKTIVYISLNPLPGYCDLLLGQDLIHVMNLVYSPRNNQIIVSLQ